MMWVRVLVTVALLLDDCKGEGCNCSAGILFVVALVGITNLVDLMRPHCPPNHRNVWIRPKTNHWIAAWDRRWWESLPQVSLSLSFSPAARTRGVIHAVATVTPKTIEVSWLNPNQSTF